MKPVRPADSFEELCSGLWAASHPGNPSPGTRESSPPTRCLLIPGTITSASLGLKQEGESQTERHQGQPEPLLSAQVGLCGASSPQEVSERLCILLTLQPQGSPSNTDSCLLEQDSLKGRSDMGQAPDSPPQGTAVGTTTSLWVPCPVTHPLRNLLVRLLHHTSNIQIGMGLPRAPATHTGCLWSYSGTGVSGGQDPTLLHPGGEGGNFTPSPPNLSFPPAKNS